MGRSIRKGTDPDGNEWSIKMSAPYGFIDGAEGTDDDPLDVFVGPNRLSPLVVIINQVNPKTGAFDEQKCILGCDNEKDAVSLYKKHYDNPEKFYKDCFCLNISQFWDFVKDRDNKGEKIKK